MPPKAKITYLTDFDLKKIEEYFHFAVFERKISKKKSHKIAHAMFENKFVDNVLRVTEYSGGEKYDVIDGQHRIDALRYAREVYGLQTYDLILFVYSEEGKREIYRRLNLGTPLTLGQHLKAIDNGRVKFFIELRLYCDHNSKGSKIRFSTAINWLFYAKSTLIRPLRPLTVDEFLPTITTKDTDQLKKYIELIQQIETNPSDNFFSYTIMRNFFRIYYENKISDEDMISLGNLIKKSSSIHNLSEKRDSHAMRGIYHYIIDRIAPELNLKLEKGIVKNKE